MRAAIPQCWEEIKYMEYYSIVWLRYIARKGKIQYALRKGCQQWQENTQLDTGSCPKYHALKKAKPTISSGILNLIYNQTRACSQTVNDFESKWLVRDSRYTEGNCSLTG